MQWSKVNHEVECDVCGVMTTVTLESPKGWKIGLHPVLCDKCTVEDWEAMLNKLKEGGK